MNAQQQRHHEANQWDMDQALELDCWEVVTKAAIHQEALRHISALDRKFYRLEYCARHGLPLSGLWAGVDVGQLADAMYDFAHGARTAREAMEHLSATLRQFNLKLPSSARLKAGLSLC